MKKFHIFAPLAVLATAAIITACGGGSAPASSSPDLTQLQAEVATLQNQVAALQTQVNGLGAAPAVFIKAPNVADIKAQLRDKSAASSCPGLGTLTGRPDNSDPLATDDLSGVSCLGFYFTVSGAATSADTADIQPPPPNVTIGFDAPNCSGNAYALTSFNGGGITRGAVANGAVFTIGDPTVATNYWMLTPATAVANPSILSVWNQGTCSSWGGSVLTGYKLAPNDSTVSGVPSAPIPGPVTIG